MFVGELVALKEKYNNRLQIIKFYSDLNIEDHFFGNIDENNLSEIFASKQELLNSDNFLICGPGNMIDNLNDFLIQKILQKTKLFSKDSHLLMSILKYQMLKILHVITHLLLMMKNMK